MSNNVRKNGNLSVFAPFIFAFVSVIQFVLFAIPSIKVSNVTLSSYEILTKGGDMTVFGPVLVSLIVNAAALLLYFFLCLYLLKYRDTRMTYIKVLYTAAGAFQLLSIILVLVYIVTFGSANVKLSAAPVIEVAVWAITFGAGVFLTVKGKEAAEDRISRSGKQRLFEGIKYVPLVAFLCLSAAIFLLMGSYDAPLNKSVYGNDVEQPSWYLYPDLFPDSYILENRKSVYTDVKNALVELNEKAAYENTGIRSANSDVRTFNLMNDFENSIIKVQNDELEDPVISSALLSRDTSSAAVPLLATYPALYPSLDWDDAEDITNAVHDYVDYKLERLNLEIEMYNKYAKSYNEATAEQNSRVDSYNKYVDEYNKAISGMDDHVKLSKQFNYEYMDLCSDIKYVPTYYEYWQILAAINSANDSINTVKGLPADVIADAELYLIPKQYASDTDVCGMRNIFIIFGALSLFFALLSAMTLVTDLRVTMRANATEGISSLLYILSLVNALVPVISIGAYNGAFIVIALVYCALTGVCALMSVAAHIFRRIRFSREPALALTEANNTLAMCTNRFGTEGMPPALDCPVGPIKGKARKSFLNELDSYKLRADVFIRAKYKKGEYISSEEKPSEEEVK